MRIEKINYNCTCNECNRSNFDSKLATKEIDNVYEVQIGISVHKLCDDCLAKLVGKIIMNK
jgi:hypothetical protein